MSKTTTPPEKNDRAEDEDDKRKRQRSPNAPIVDLEAALEHTKKLYKYANGRHPVPMAGAFVKAWEMTEDSAYGKQVVAAIKSFGLIGDEGSGKNRKILVTDVGEKILHNHSDKQKLIKAAALTPPIYTELWQKYAANGNLAPDESLRQYLVFDRVGTRFNIKSVDDAIGVFRKTVSFAQLGAGDTIVGADSEENGEHGKGKVPPPPPIRQAMIPTGQTNVKIEELTFPLIGGGMAVLKAPVPMTEANFELLHAMLKAMKAAIVSDSKKSAEAND